MKFTEDELRALQVLANGHEFGRVMNALARFCEENNKLLVMGKHDSGQLLRQQGRTQSLVQFMEAIIDAPKSLEKFSEPKDR